MDDLDRSIIALLRADARLSLAVLARRLKVARSTIQTRLERLPPEVGLDVDLKSAIDDSLRPSSRTTAALLGPVVAA